MNVQVSGLRDLLELADSGTWGEDGNPNTGSPVLRSSNIQGGQLDLTDFAWRVIPENDRERCRLEPGDIIITKSSGSANLIGKCCIFDAEDSNGPYYFSNFTLRLRVKGGVADHRWIYYWLISERGRAALASLNNTTSGLRNLSVPRYLEQKLPTPSLEEQRRIAAILDKADAIRRKRQEAIALTEQLLRSTFLEVFGDPVTNPKRWPVSTFGEVLEELRYGTSEKCSDRPDSGTIPVLRIPNIVSGLIDLQDLKYAPLTESERYLIRLRDGDILFVRSNGNPEYIGRCAVFHGQGDYAFASYLIRGRIREGAGYLVDFAQAVLSFPTFVSQLVREAKTTAGNYNISTAGLRSLRMIHPPQELQEAFLGKTRKITGLVQRYKASLSEADNLFNSLVQRAFSGQL